MRLNRWRTLSKDYERWSYLLPRTELLQPPAEVRPFFALHPLQQLRLAGWGQQQRAAACCCWSGCLWQLKVGAFCCSQLDVSRQQLLPSLQLLTFPKTVLASVAAGRIHPSAPVGRFRPHPAPQDPSQYKRWKHLQQSLDVPSHARQLLQAGTAPAASAAGSTSGSSSGAGSSSSSTSSPPTQPASINGPGSPARSRLAGLASRLQRPQQQSTREPPATADSSRQKVQGTAAAPTANVAAGPATLCPAWAPSVATTKHTIGPDADLGTTKDLTIVTNLNASPAGGITTKDRADAESAALAAALRNATGNVTLAGEAIQLAPPPGLFEPLSEEEIMAGEVLWRWQNALARLLTCMPAHDSLVATVPAPLCSN